MNLNAELFEKVGRLKNLLVSWVTGNRNEELAAEYEELRSELVRSPVGLKLPQVTKSYRTFEEFGHFIRQNFPEYAERRAYVHEQFEPLMNELERLAAGEKNRNVFVVHGRNESARRELFSFLRALGLNPLEWPEAVKLTGKGAPFVGEVLEAGFNAAQATVVLMTPDDEARLREPYRHSPEDEGQLQGQPRQNVLFEAGMAMGKHPNQTIIVELGKLRPMSDVAGRHAIRMDDTPEKRNELAGRLETAGCSVNRSASDWYSAGNFNDVISEIKQTVPAPKLAAPTPQPFELDDGAKLSDEENRYLMDIRRPRNSEAYPVIDVYERWPPDQAKYREMLEHFVELGLMRKGGTFFSLTTKGETVADEFWRKTILQVLAQHGRDFVTGFVQVQLSVKLNDRGEDAELSRHLNTLRDERKLNLLPGGGIQITPLGMDAVDSPPTTGSQVAQLLPASTKQKMTPPGKLSKRPLKNSELSQLSKAERQCLLDLRQASGGLHTNPLNPDSKLTRMLMGLVELGLLEKTQESEHETWFDLTTDGEFIADMLWQNTLLQAIAGAERSGSLASEASLAAAFGFDLEDGPERREIDRHLKALKMRSVVACGDYDTLVLVQPYADQTLQNEGLGMGG